MMTDGRRIANRLIVASGANGGRNGLRRRCIGLLLMLVLVLKMVLMLMLIGVRVVLIML